ncbi:digalactosyldiacylglycerol synthase 2, chloroplastic-like [Vicia villosa]|uniref:digalactosyldiacylglycerol synthase 2, chloroplastic-like n=1 Tax=Vicia villosa TaxID=3911 RepID=UPI00273BBDD3|nr:digalactosyldiacylglycerol synthase 2, chloroplastic-like [Vicia villosa]XP_058739889.1 digalactosyldiacylglycerol synthase 2, chloroplastic-like [Vicia villosa]XP_058739890.1 digalactosyldiacylglycerol synthase 2, chloroplastic-like [Vicia villosa]
MDKKQHFAIFTTASLPWLTGTAVNPLFRAAYLYKAGERNVTLLIPWLSLKDQKVVYPNNMTFESPEEQEKYIRQWLEDRLGFASGFSIKFYPGKFSRDKRSILAVGDISEMIPDEEADIAVLEEPEHLTWYHHGKRWKTKFRLVIGIIHTNYLEYVKREKNGNLQAFLLKYLNNWVVGIYCHKVIRLSAATQDYPGSIVCNVHGVNPKFLEIGKKKRDQQQNEDNNAFTKGAYFIGKMVWSKGYKELLQLLNKHQKELSALELDLFGSGEDSDEVQKAAKKLEMTVRVHPGRDHADELFHDFRLFLNPSTTDVVCTTTAEALAMGKIVVCADHCSNEFFKQFPNCWTYNNPEEFVQLTLKALAEKPDQPTDDQRHDLSWEAATERFLKAADLDKPSERKLLSRSTSNYLSTSLSLQQTVEDASAYVHHVASGFEISRRIFGAIPDSLQPDEQLRKELGYSKSFKK